MKDDRFRGRAPLKQDDEPRNRLLKHLHRPLQIVVRLEKPPLAAESSLISDLARLGVSFFCDELRSAEDKTEKSLTPIACG